MSSKWEKLENGDGLTDEELESMIKETESVILYCDDRGEKFDLMRFRCFRDLVELRDFYYHRINK